MVLTYHSKGVDDLERFAEVFLAALPIDANVRFEAEMGAGKTSFISKICNELSIDEVSSPTYSIVNEYKGDRLVYHFDFYRLEDEDEAMDLGIEEYLDGPGLCLMEWPERLPSILDDQMPLLRIDVLNDEERKFILSF
jgi:tRNA threonylcarbamoyladenosine biosynthesis protein TsaE